MRNRKTATTSDFYCVRCGNKGIPIARKIGSQREAGHLKKLYCLHCQEQTNHAEIRPFGAYHYEDFKLEFELGRFVNDLRVPITECLGSSNIEWKYNVNGKCWNCNETYDCGHRILRRHKNEE